MNEQTQPAPPFFVLVLVVAAGAAYGLALSPIGDAVRAAWDTLTIAIATVLGA